MSSPSAQSGESQGSVLCEQRGALGLVRIHRPERRNALERSTAIELRQTIERLVATETVFVIVLSGSGGTFCSGGDLSTLRAAARTDPEGTLRDFHELILAIARTDKPIIASLAGAAAGFGADLALAADMRLADETAFLQESFIQVGLLADGGGTSFLPERLGYGKAFELLALGERVGAQELLRLGLVERLVPSGALDDEVLRVGEALAARPPLALRAIKRTLRAARMSDLEAALARVRTEQIALLQSRDFSEGVSAFLEKRKPTFRGE